MLQFENQEGKRSILETQEEMCDSADKTNKMLNLTEVKFRIEDQLQKKDKRILDL